VAPPTNHHSSFPLSTYRKGYDFSQEQAISFERGLFPTGDGTPAPSLNDAISPSRYEVGSRAGTEASIARRSTGARYFCNVRGCTSQGFTTKANYD
ncbi:hypothetical protein PQX77_001252, partial [Marasmius sp. AFHP31]